MKPNYRRMTTDTMNVSLMKFSLAEFGQKIDTLDHDKIQNFMDSVNTIVHSHRFKRKDPFTESLDFNVIRDLLYSYSIEARDRLLNDEHFGFLFTNFVTKEGEMMLESKKREGYSDKYIKALREEMDILYKQADKAVVL